MANSIDATLINEVLAQRAITAVQAKLSYIKDFSTDFSSELRDQRSLTVNVPVLTTGSAAQVNPTNYESGDTTAVNAPVTMAHVSKSFYLTPADYSSGMRLEHLADINIAIVLAKIESLIFTPITEANFGSPAVTGITAGATSAANLKTLWGALPGDKKILILKDTEFVNFLPADLNSFDVTKVKSGYGFDVMDRSGAGFASAGTKIVGFAANPSALAFASALPVYAPELAEQLSSEVIDVPGVGISLQLNRWVSTASRNVWASYDVLFGAAKADGNALKLLKTA